MNSGLLRQYLSFYQDLGIKTLYRRPAEIKAEENVLPSLTAGGETLTKIQQDLGDCTRCPLHAGRNKIVFGAGNPEAKIVFVGEGPGADEDAQGIPFVGRAGQLLTQMIENTTKGEGIPLLRKDVYICNVVKCRPPGNRTPEPGEMEICEEFLFRQLVAINPKAIVALGGTAAKALLGKREGVTRLRGQWHRWRDIPVMVTFHPSYLLRAYNKDAKREAWEDLKKAFTMSTTKPKPGLFITFEGIDGCGKSTQMRLLIGRLREAGFDVVETVEPGGTSVGVQIRRVLLDARNQEILPITELLLYFASRAQNVEERIRPAIANGQIVVSDRYTDSTMVYQGFARGLGEQIVADLHRVACGGLNPDLTIYLDIDLATSLTRAAARNSALTGDEAIETRMDEQSAEFYRRVRDGYEALAAREPERFRVIGGGGKAEAVAADIWDAVRQKIGEGA